MAYMLRFVQQFNPADERVFMDLEKKFAALERQAEGAGINLTVAGSPDTPWFGNVSFRHWKV
jgi:hypothetical protein